MFRLILSIWWITIFYQSPIHFCDAQKRLVVLGVLPLSGDRGYQGNHIKPYIEHALREVNSNTSVLPGYKLVVKWVDSKCEMAVATKSIFDALHTDEETVFIYGGYCNSVTKYIAESASYMSLWQISFANTDPTLSDSATYQNFLRVIPNELDLNLVWIHFLKAYDWTRVALLFQDASSGVSTYAYTHNEMISLLKETGVDITTTESVTENPGLALNKVREFDSRIIIGNFDDSIALKTICMCYHMGMYGYKYVWMLTQASRYPDHWWKHSDNCTEGEMRKALDGHFTANIMSSHIIENSENQLLYGMQEPYGGYAYDGVWLMAKTLNKFIRDSKPGTPNWENWRQMKNHSYITNEHFSGYTGEVNFEGRNRQGLLQLNQRQDGVYVKVGHLDMSEGVLNFSRQDIRWHGHSVAPLDRIIKENQVIKPHIVIHTLLVILASLGLLLAISFLAINIKYASHRHIKMSSPKMNNVIVVGCILVYCSIFILRVDPSSVSAETLQIICIVRTWVLSLGFSLSFGALFAKTWRVYSIFNSPHSQNKKLITDTALFVIVILLITVDLISLITWAIVDPLQLKTGYLEPIEVENKLIKRLIYTCESRKMNLWAAIIYIYKGLLLVVGCFFAWQTRHVNIPALNDSKYIGMSVYNVVIMCTSAVAVSYVIGDKQDHRDLVIGLLVILCTTITLCLVFLPKIMHLREDPKGTAPRPRLSMKQTSRKSILPHRPSMEDLNSIALKIIQLEEEISQNQTKQNRVTRELADLSNAHKTKKKVCSTTSNSSQWSAMFETATIMESLSPNLDMKMSGNHAKSPVGTDCTEQTKGKFFFPEPTEQNIDEVIQSLPAQSEDIDADNTNGLSRRNSSKSSCEKLQQFTTVV